MDVNPDNRYSSSSISPAPPWRRIEVVGAFLLIPASMLMLSSFLPLTKDASWWVLLVRYFLFYILWVAFFAYLFIRYKKPAWDALGLRIDKPWHQYILEGLSCSAVIFSIGIVLGLLAQWFGLSYQQPYEAFGDAQLEVIAVLAILFAPLIEELIFRGLLQSTLAQRTPSWLAMSLTSLVFVLFHSQYHQYWMAMAYVSLMALVLSIYRHLTKSLIPCVIGHFLNNLLAACVLFQQRLS